LQSLDGNDRIGVALQLMQGLQRLPEELAMRLQELLDNPAG
jgi:hypothetical protein